MKSARDMGQIKPQDINSLKWRWRVVGIALMLVTLGTAMLLTSRPTMATPIPCGSWSHSSWSSGQVTWTKAPDSCWTATIAPANETCVWKDTCANTTKPDDNHPVSYTTNYVTLVKPDPNNNGTWYFEAKFTATSACDGADDVVVDTHPYDDCRCGCTCGQ
jgi:hypothetical protein